MGIAQGIALLARHYRVEGTGIRKKFVGVYGRCAVTFLAIQEVAPL